MLMSKSPWFGTHCSTCHTAYVVHALKPAFALSTEEYLDYYSISRETVESTGRSCRRRAGNWGPVISSQGLITLGWMQLRHTDGGVACPTILMVSLPILEEIGCLTKPYSTSRLSRPLTSYLLTLQKVYSIPLPKRGPSTSRRKYK